MNHKRYVIERGVKSETLFEFQIWIKEYAVKYFQLFKVVHLDVQKRYTVRCEDGGCSWTVRARPFKGGTE
jgi:hypothetical protein